MFLLIIDHTIKIDHYHQIVERHGGVVHVRDFQTNAVERLGVLEIDHQDGVFVEIAKAVGVGAVGHDDTVLDELGGDIGRREGIEAGLAGVLLFFAHDHARGGVVDRKFEMQVRAIVGQRTVRDGLSGQVLGVHGVDFQAHHALDLIREDVIIAQGRRRLRFQRDRDLDLGQTRPLRVQGNRRSLVGQGLGLNCRHGHSCCWVVN